MREWLLPGLVREKHGALRETSHILMEGLSTEIRITERFQLSYHHSNSNEMKWLFAAN